MRYLTSAGVMALAGLGLAACGPVEDLECGSGTIEQNGVCVINVDTAVTCAEGTKLDADTHQCVPFRSCGEGAVLAGSECVPLAEGCGRGSTLDAASGNCVPEIECGPGTYLEEQQCLPEVVCGPGTIFVAETATCEAPVNPCLGTAVLNPTTGRCESSLVCGVGHVEVNGKCYPKGRGLAGEADFTEAHQEDNDPALGGTPEQMGALADAGDALVFVGTIGRPTDINRDGKSDQDRDAWSFTAEAGTFVRVRVLSNGLPQPYFTLEGPRSYRRHSALGYVTDAERYIFLPYDGTYVITVEPALHALAGIQLGGNEASYIGVIEPVQRPAALAITPSLDPVNNPVTVSGSLTDWRNNLWLLEAPAGSAVVIRVPEVDPDVVPAVLAFDGNNNPITDLVLDSASNRWAGTFADATNDVWLFVDWESSVGPRADYTASLTYVRVQEVGAFPAGTSLATEPETLQPNEVMAFRYELNDASVVSAQVSAGTPLNADLQLLGPGATEIATYGVPDIFYYGTSARYALFVRNAAAVVRNGVRMGGRLSPLMDLGEISAASPTVTYSGAGLSWRYGANQVQWAVLRTPRHRALELAIEVESGEPALTVLSPEGGRVRKITRGHLGTPTYVFTDSRDVHLLRLEPNPPGSSEVVRPVVDWQVTLQLRELPPVIDQEPNDSQANAVPLGSLPAWGMGQLEELAVVFEQRDKDIYSFTLPAPLAADEAVAIHLDNIDADPDEVIDYGAISLRIYDKDFNFIQSLPGQEGSANPGVMSATTVYYLSSAEGTGPFYLDLTDSRVDNISRYVLGVEVVPMLTEVEPNDGIGEATELPGVGATVAGVYNSGAGGPGDVDFYRLPVSEVMPGRSLVVKVQNLEDAQAVRLQVQREAGGYNGLFDGSFIMLRDTDPQPGTYLIAVRRAGVAANSFPTYRLTTYWGAPSEKEPNDGAANANVLPTLDGEPLVVEGTTGPGQRDVFQFSLATSPGEREGVRVRAYNLSDLNHLRVELADGPDPDSNPRLAFDQGAGAEVVGALTGTGPYAVTVVAVTGTPAYRLVIERASQLEREPNDALLEATTIDIPSQVEGTIYRNDIDVFAVQNFFMMDAHEALEIRWVNTDHTRSISVELIDSNGSTSLGSKSEVSGMLRSPTGLGPGTYYVRVQQPLGSVVRADLYQLTVRKVTVEP